MSYTIQLYQIYEPCGGCRPVILFFYKLTYMLDYAWSTGQEWRLANKQPLLKVHENVGEDIVLFYHCAKKPVTTMLIIPLEMYNFTL